MCYIAFFQILSIPDPNGTATITQTSLDNLFWQSQWHSDCYTDFFWQFLLTIPMAQQLLHRLLLAISFNNPNGTATVTQTSFGNFFWQSQWHSDCYTDFFWQFRWQSQWHSDCYTDFFWQSFLTIPMAQHVPYSFCWLPLHLNSSWHRNHYIEFFWHTRMWQSQWHSVCHLAFESLCIFNVFLAIPAPATKHSDRDSF